MQIEVVGNGTVELPAGVSFPGAYKYSDPGVVHNVGFVVFSVCWVACAKEANRRKNEIDLLLDRNRENRNRAMHHDVSDSRADGLVWGLAGHNTGECRACLGREQHSDTLE